MAFVVDLCIRPVSQARVLSSICPCKSKPRESWESFEDESGRVYYFERISGRTQWEVPGRL